MWKRTSWPPCQGGAPLDLLLTNRQGLVGDKVVRGCLRHSYQEMRDFSILGERRREVNKTSTLHFWRVDFGLFRTLFWRAPCKAALKIRGVQEGWNLEGRGADRTSHAERWAGEKADWTGWARSFLRKSGKKGVCMTFGKRVRKVRKCSRMLSGHVERKFLHCFLKDLFRKSTAVLCLTIYSLSRSELLFFLLFSSGYQSNLMWPYPCITAYAWEKRT